MKKNRREFYSFPKKFPKLFVSVKYVVSFGFNYFWEIKLIILIRLGVAGTRRTSFFFSATDFGGRNKFHDFTLF